MIVYTCDRCVDKRVWFDGHHHIHLRERLCPTCMHEVNPPQRLPRARAPAQEPKLQHEIDAETARRWAKETKGG